MAELNLVKGDILRAHSLGVHVRHEDVPPQPKPIAEIYETALARKHAEFYEMELSRNNWRFLACLGIAAGIVYGFVKLLEVAAR